MCRIAGRTQDARQPPSGRRATLDLGLQASERIMYALAQDRQRPAICDPPQDASGRAIAQLEYHRAAATTFLLQPPAAATLDPAHTLPGQLIRC